MTNETFKLVRLFLKMNQIEFSEYMELAYSTVAGIEAGNRSVTENVRGKIAHKFEANKDFIEFVDRNKRLNI